MPSSPDASTETVVSASTQSPETAARGRRWRRLAVAGVAAFVLTGLFNVWGPRQHTERADGDQHELSVSAPRVSRGGLAASWSATVRRHDGAPLPSEVEIIVEQSYLAIFDQHAVDPTPAETWSQGDAVHWVFELPADVTEFRVALDARIQPGSRWSHDGSVTVNVGDDSVTAEWTTWLVP